MVVEAYLGSKFAERQKRLRAMAEPLLRIQNLCAGYGDVQVLWGADLTVERGEHRLPRRLERRGQVHAAAHDLRV